VRDGLKPDPLLDFGRAPRMIEVAVGDEEVFYSGGVGDLPDVREQPLHAVSASGVHERAFFSEFYQVNRRILGGGERAAADLEDLTRNFHVRLPQYGSFKGASRVYRPGMAGWKACPRRLRLQLAVLPFVPEKTAW